MFDYLIKKLKRKEKSDFVFKNLTYLLQDFLAFIDKRINIKPEAFLLEFKHLKQGLCEYYLKSSKIHVVIDAQKLSQIVKENVQHAGVSDKTNIFLGTFYAHVLSLSAYAILNIEGLPSKQAKQQAIILVDEFWNYRFNQPEYIV